DDNTALLALLEPAAQTLGRGGVGERAGLHAVEDALVAEIDPRRRHGELRQLGIGLLDAGPFGGGRLLALDRRQLDAPAPPAGGGLGDRHRRLGDRRDGSGLGRRSGGGGGGGRRARWSGGGRAAGWRGGRLGLDRAARGGRRGGRLA